MHEPILQVMNSKYQSFVNYYHSNKDKLFTYLMYRLGFDRALAEDLMMDIFLIAYERLDQFDPKESSFQIWLFRLAHNHLANRPRARTEKKAESPEEWIERHSTEADEVEYPMTEHIDNKHVQYLFTLLSEEDREIISLRYLQGLDPEKISKIINKKMEAIRIHLQQALNRLAGLYKKVYLPEPPGA